MLGGVPADNVGRSGGPADSITYRFVMYRPLILTLFSVLGVAGIAMLLNLLVGGVGPPAWFVFFWLAAYAWNAYWYVVRIAFEVGVSGSMLRWRSMTTSREVPLARVTGIRTPFPPFGVGLKRITVDGDRSPLIIANGGYRDVVEMIARFRPDLDIQSGRIDRLFERFAQRSVRWRRLETK